MALYDYKQAVNDLQTFCRERDELCGGNHRASIPDAVTVYSEAADEPL